MLDFAATPDNRRLQLERVLPAPRELVWKMFSDPYHLAQWWGPKGCTNPIVELDFRVGGRWYHAMHCLDGNDYPADSEFVEITPPERIVYRNRRIDDPVFGDNPPPAFFRIITFTALPDGHTLLKIDAHFDTADQKDAVVRRGFREGVMESFDKLVLHLERGSEVKFTATIHQIGNNTGIDVPPAVRDALGGGKNPLVKVTLAGHTWRSKIATMGDKLLIGVSAEIRRITGVKGGETHEVELLLDDQPRIVEAPGDLQAALDADPVAKAAWNKLAPSHKKAHVTAIEGAKAPETRLRRVQKAIEMLTEG